MLKKFTVINFKNFEKELVLDFTRIRDYEFNKELIKNNLINKLLIYGLNNSGKSNLGAAIMDITTHLTNNNVENALYKYYVNGNSEEEIVSFKYEFLLENKNITYLYTKNNEERKLLSEELWEEQELLFKYNYQNNKFTNNILEAKTIDITKRNTDTSVLKYIYTNNIYWEKNSVIKKLMDFVSNMLWFRSLRNNEFIGLMNNNENLNDFIINNHLLEEFQKFLKECGQDYNLCETENWGRKVIGVKFKKYIADFVSVASTGTKSLWLLFYWLKQTENISFLFLDEFDAFYHYELSSHILKYVNSISSFQTVFTSHNTYLITNELMRPDCYAILKNGKIKTFADSTDKTIREAHNLEKMMLGGEFEK